MLYVIPHLPGMKEEPQPSLLWCGKEESSPEARWGNQLPANLPKLSPFVPPTPQAGKHCHDVTGLF